jgi:hypothetical protein
MRELLELVETHRRWREAVAERARDPRVAMHDRQRAFLSLELARTEVPAGTRCGERIGRYIGLTTITKVSVAHMGRFYGRTSRIERQAHGMIINATVDCFGMSAKKLRKAFEKASRLQLDQMARKDLPSAGIVLDTDVGEDGRVGIRAVLTDPVAAAKAIAAVYTGLVIDVDDDGIDGISLVDAPADFVKTSGAGQVIAKVFTREGANSVKKAKKMKKALQKAMGAPSNAVEQAVAIMSRPIIPDVSDMGKRSQAFADFQALYHATRQPIAPSFAFGAQPTGGRR